MLDSIVIGGKNKTVEVLALAALGTDGIPHIVNVNNSGALVNASNSGLKLPAATCPESFVVGGKAKTVNVGLGVCKKPDETLGAISLDGNGNVK